jgi:cell division protein FtsW (lipid II flippase)
MSHRIGAEIGIVGACLGSLLLTALVLPRPRDEFGGNDRGTHRVLVEVVGYAIEADFGGIPISLGASTGADLRLVGDGLAGIRAVLVPPRTSPGTWYASTGDPNSEVALERGARNVPTASPSVAPWRPPRSGDGGREIMGVGGTVALLQPIDRSVFRLDSGQGSPEKVEIVGRGDMLARGHLQPFVVLWCGGSPGTAWWTHARDLRGNPNASQFCGEIKARQASAWRNVDRCIPLFPNRAPCREGELPGSVAVTSASGTQVVGGGTRAGNAGQVWVVAPSGRLDSVRVGLSAATVADACAAGIPCPPPALTLRDAAGDSIGSLAPVSLSGGDLLRIDGQSYLVREHRSPAGGGPAVLELLRVRAPRAFSALRASAGTELYHPEQRLLWEVPPCDSARSTLTLSFHRSAGAPAVPAAVGPAADAADGDRALAQSFFRSAGGRASLHRIEGGGRSLERSPRDVGVCVAGSGTDERRVRFSAQPGTPLRLETAPGIRREIASGASVSIGTTRRPNELLLTVDGLLVRVGPSTARAVQAHTRKGLLYFLFFITLLQAVPLVRSRRERLLLLGEEQDDITPGMGAATGLQVVAAAMSCLLLIGCAYQLSLAVDPALVGAPHYAQRVLEAAIYCSVLATAAAWYAMGGAQPGMRVAIGIVGAVLASLAALGWWGGDALLQPSTPWLSELRGGPSREAASGMAVKLAVACAAGLAIVAVVTGRRDVLSETPPQPAGARPHAAGAHPPTTGERLRAAKRRLKKAGKRLVGSRVRRVLRRLPCVRGLKHDREARLRWASVRFIVLGGLVAYARSSGLALGLGLLAFTAAYGAATWGYQSGSITEDEGLEPKQRAQALGSGIVFLLVLVAFLFVSSLLPPFAGGVLVCAGAVLLGYLFGRAKTDGLGSTRWMPVCWTVVFMVSFVGIAAVFGDPGGWAAWLPALLAGMLLWTIRPDEARRTPGEVRRGWIHLGLSVAVGLLMLGGPSVATWVLGNWNAEWLERARQRVVLAQDVTYLSVGEWLTQVRWLVTGDGPLGWVPNLNSDVALFGVRVGLGAPAALAVAVLILVQVLTLLYVADQSLRQGWLAEKPAWAASVRYRFFGLFLGMVGVLLLSQWLVHLSTGITLAFPITGLALPWVSHGSTTHLLYSCALTFPLAALAAEEERAEGVRRSPSPPGRRRP